MIKPWRKCAGCFLRDLIAVRCNRDAELRLSSDALSEYTEATTYYFERASPIVAAGFIAAVEALVQTILDSPGRWRIVGRGEIRRCLAEGYPYAIYYQWRPEENYVRIYAVMLLSRRPRYWRKRLRE